MPVAWTECVLNTTDIVKEILTVIFHLVTFSACLSSNVIIVIHVIYSFLGNSPASEF